jgi:hypothetical protein
MEIVIAITAGLFSLLGAFAGAALARRTDYERWLRENRSEVFAKPVGCAEERTASYAAGSDWAIELKWAR